MSTEWDKDLPDVEVTESALAGEVVCYQLRAAAVGIRSNRGEVTKILSE